MNLKKMKMPTPEGQDPMLSLDMGMESAEEEQEQGEQEEEEEVQEATDLSSVSDEDLVKEIKKRGLRI